MANEDRLRLGGMEGTLAADLTTGATTIDLGSDPGALALLDGSTNHWPIIIPSTGEILHAVADLGSGQATVQRAREATSDPGVTTPSGAAWRHGPTIWDFWTHKEPWGGDLGYDQEFTRHRAADDAAERVVLAQSGHGDLHREA